MPRLSNVHIIEYKWLLSLRCECCQQWFCQCQSGIRMVQTKMDVKTPHQVEFYFFVGIMIYVDPKNFMLEREKPKSWTVYLISPQRRSFTHQQERGALQAATRNPLSHQWSPQEGHPRLRPKIQCLHLTTPSNQSKLCPGFESTTMKATF